MKITIHGNTISKKNSKRIVTTGNGKHRVISSGSYLQWANDAMWQLKQYQPQPWHYPVRARFTFYRKTIKDVFIVSTGGIRANSFFLYTLNFKQF